MSLNLYTDIPSHRHHFAAAAFFSFSLSSLSLRSTFSSQKTTFSKPALFFWIQLILDGFPLDPFFNSTYSRQPHRIPWATITCEPTPPLQLHPLKFLRSRRAGRTSSHLLTAVIQTALTRTRRDLNNEVCHPLGEVLIRRTSNLSPRPIQTSTMVVAIRGVILSHLRSLLKWLQLN